MLEREALIAYGRQQGMPVGKIRGLLREYLQVLTLRELYKIPGGKDFYFTGGTYLRLVQKIRRFSEDLDFNVSGLKKNDFESAMETVRRGLTREGLRVQLDFRHWGNILAADLVFPDVEEYYGIISPHRRKAGLMIKVEANQPRWKIKAETLMVAGFGAMFPVVCTDKGALFADKIDALLRKDRARHLFDIMFMLSQQYPVDRKILRRLGVKEPPMEVIQARVTALSPTDLKKQADQLMPFLFEESEADLIRHAREIVPQLIQRYEGL